MNEEQKKQDIPIPFSSDINNQNIMPFKKRRIKSWQIILAVFSLLFIIGGFFVWQKYQKQEVQPPLQADLNIESPKEEVAANTIKSLYDSKDIKRKIDLVNFLLALQNYKKDKNVFPSTNGVTEKTEDKNSIIYSLAPKYIKSIAIDAKSPDFYYGYTSDGKSFTITARLENEKDPDCYNTGKICLYKLTEKNNEEELLKIVRENLDFINSVRVVTGGKMLTQINGGEIIDFSGDDNGGKNTAEFLIDYNNKRAYMSGGNNSGIGFGNSELIVINGKNYLKGGMVGLLTGAKDWIEVKEGDDYPQISDETRGVYHLVDPFEKFGYINGLGMVQKVSIENIDGRTYYHLSLKPKKKERNAFLDEFLKPKLKESGVKESLDEIFKDDGKEDMFLEERVFKFDVNGQEIIIPFSKLINRPVYFTVTSYSNYTGDKNARPDQYSYNIKTTSISDDIWVDQETLIPLKEESSIYDVSYYYDFKDKEKFSFESFYDTRTNNQYFDINKEFDIKVPKLVKVNDPAGDEKLASICNKISGGIAKAQCIETVNSKKLLYLGREIPSINSLEDCEKIPHSTYSSNQPHDDCVLGLFYKTKDISLCDKVIDHMERRVSCYTEAAKMTGNKDYCQKINYDYMGEWCKNNVSSSLICHGEDANILNFNEPKELIDGWEKRCIIMADKDVNNCIGLNEAGQGEDSCYYDMAILKEDITICDKISPEYYGKNSCYAKVAMAKKDTSLCNKISGESDKKNCVKAVLMANGDESACEKILNSREKNDCYLELVFSLIQK